MGGVVCCTGLEELELLVVAGGVVVVGGAGGVPVPPVLGGAGGVPGDVPVGGVLELELVAFVSVLGESTLGGSTLVAGALLEVDAGVGLDDELVRALTGSLCLGEEVVVAGGVCVTGALTGSLCLGEEVVVAGGDCVTGALTGSLCFGEGVVVAGGELITVAAPLDAWLALALELLPDVAGGSTVAGGAAGADALDPEDDDGALDDAGGIWPTCVGILVPIVTFPRMS